MNPPQCPRCGSRLEKLTVSLRVYATLPFLVCSSCKYVRRDPSQRGWIDGHLDRAIITLNLISSVSPSSRKPVVLDAGAAPGYITQMVRWLLGCEVFGLDSSRVISSAGRDFQAYVREMEQGGIPILDCDLDVDPFPFADQTFDLVLFTEVIEHLHNPLHALSEIRRVLKRGGWLILSTPNLLRVSNRLRRLMRRPMTFHGVREYGVRELKELLSRAGLTVAKVIFSDWSERKYLKKLRYGRLRFSPSALWFILKYGIVRLIPSLSSYMFILAIKS